ncbi:hypothetical protein QWY93_14830 [Echinicola jeungdonensis]|uniref:Uncharacterized protein n=1 Tax=Echinicola jeungdonensis TaxID=709343 RepID=A0ABV5J349_9BACT|nr:hypothetical protein [Echinicola jeungdonensis]MDN3670595.1 hypothetical protein [Echinicola jeungdonensis]
METVVTLLMLTTIYGLVFLGLYPERYLKKFSHKYRNQNAPPYLKLRLSEPFFISFLAGYLLASAMMYFFP